ncbi:phosphoribosylformylglycinamidine cyclo-ligase [Mycoplasma sp. P36-A1]|uniref:phosphoribosylformylglycinamidine cyclo-ligase n=1 Tax=Mycoplasma sp. P36-A1 TaxID=3252900 RepID=UPI003C2F8E9A
MNTENKYKEAGVDVHAGYESVELIKKHVAKTKNLGMVENIGGFGAVFDLSAYNYKKPLLVSGTDGVGTKLEIARELKKLDTIGIDLVGMCVNDIITCGAKPLFFLDYIAVAKNNPKEIEQLVKGICDGLIQCDVALIGGETAEMPGVYQEGGFDLAGYVTGAVEKDEILKPDQVKPNQVLISLPSSGIHSNGYSLVRKIVKDANLDYNEIYQELDKEKTLGEVLLQPTKIYVNEILNLLKQVDVKGLTHVTGGGFYENIKRTTKQYGAKIDENNLNILPIFKFLEEKGKLLRQEMYGYFNMGSGMIVIVEEKDVNKTLELLSDATVIGKVVADGNISVC